MLYGTVTYKSSRTGEVLATTNSWRIPFTPLVNTVLGLSPQQRFALMDALLPAGCSFDSRKPLPGTDTYLEKRFWLEEFKPKDLALPAIPDVPLTALSRYYPAQAMAPGLPSAQQAVARDPKLHPLLVALFAQTGQNLTSEQRTQVRARVRELLWRLTDSAHLDPKSRGFHVDARDLGVMERVMGQRYWGIGGPNPNQEAGRILTESFNALLDQKVDKLAEKEPPTR